MPIDNWIASWREHISPHFVINEANDRTEHLQKIASPEISARVLIARRATQATGGARTILVAYADSLVDSGAALYWAAHVRDTLPEPETSDIYLFLEIASASLEDCLRLEADDQYCRKYVRRPNESGVDFLKRTFLAAPVAPRRVGEMADPLSVSLLNTAEYHPWFSSDEQKHWRQALLSGLSGAEIAAQLLMKAPGDKT